MGYLNCSETDIDCLMNKTADEILMAQNNSSSELVSSNALTLGEQWGPYIDGHIIKSQLLNVNDWLTNKFKLNPIIAGVTSGEGIGFVFGSEEIQNIEKKIPSISNTTSYKDAKTKLSKLVTDLLFTCSLNSFLNSYEKHQKDVYTYLYDYPLDFDFRADEPYCKGFACHVVDMAYVFGNPNNLFSERGKLLSRQIMDYWTNFAKNSTPNSKENFTFAGKKYNNIKWPKYNPDTIKELVFTNTTNIIKKIQKKTVCNINLNRYLEKIGEGFKLFKGMIKIFKYFFMV